MENAFLSWQLHIFFHFPLLLVGRFVAFPPLQVSLVQRFGFLSGAVLLGL
jgi:hypothetical protein